MYFKTILLVAAVVFQCYVPEAEAARLRKLRPLEQPTTTSPNELLEQLRQVVLKSVELGIETLNTVKENSTKSTAGIQDTAKVQLGNLRDQLVHDLDVMESKAKAKKIDPSECVYDAKSQVAWVFDSDSLQVDQCIYWFHNTIGVNYKHGVDKLQSFKNLEPQLRKELEDCKDSDECKEKVSKKISQAIKTTPGKIKNSIDSTVKLIGLNPLKECVAEVEGKFTVVEEEIFNGAHVCIYNQQ